MIDLKPDAVIVISTHYTYLRDRIYTYNSYEWEGGSVAEISINELNHSFNTWAEEGAIIKLGLFLRIRVVKCQFQSWRFLVMREGWAAWATWRLHQLFWRLDLFYRRLILAASIFKLANCSPDEIPHWRQLRWFGEK